MYKKKPKRCGWRMRDEGNSKITTTPNVPNQNKANKKCTTTTAATTKNLDALTHTLTHSRMQLKERTNKRGRSNGQVGLSSDRLKTIALLLINSELKRVLSDVCACVCLLVCYCFYPFDSLTHMHNCTATPNPNELLWALTHLNDFTHSDSFAWTEPAFDSVLLFFRCCCCRCCYFCISFHECYASFSLLTALHENRVPMQLLKDVISFLLFCYSYVLCLLRHAHFIQCSSSFQLFSSEKTYTFFFVSYMRFHNSSKFL